MIDKIYDLRKSNAKFVKFQEYLKTLKEMNEYDGEKIKRYEKMITDWLLCEPKSVLLILDDESKSNEIYKDLEYKENIDMLKILNVSEAFLEELNSQSRYIVSLKEKGIFINKNDFPKLLYVDTENKYDLTQTTKDNFINFKNLIEYILENWEDDKEAVKEIKRWRNNVINYLGEEDNILAFSANDNYNNPDEFERFYNDLINGLNQNISVPYDIFTENKDGIKFIYSPDDFTIYINKKDFPNIIY